MIDICLPTFLHEDYIIKAAYAKKHIICEKPLTLSVASMKRIWKAVEANNVQLYVGHILRFWPEYQTIKSYHHKQKLGDIVIVHAQRLGQTPKWSTWFQNHQKSGGALYDLHIHDIDFTYSLLGEVNSVYASGIQNKQGAWVHVMTNLIFKNGSKAFIEASHLMPLEYPFSISYRTQTKETSMDLVIKAAENIEEIDHENGYFTLYSNQETIPLQVDNQDAFFNELTYFMECIQENKPNTIIPLSDVMYTLQLLELIEQSLQSGQVIHV